MKILDEHIALPYQSLFLLHAAPYQNLLFEPVDKLFNP